MKVFGCRSLLTAIPIAGVAVLIVYQSCQAAGSQKATDKPAPTTSTQATSTHTTSTQATSTQATSTQATSTQATSTHTISTHTNVTHAVNTHKTSPHAPKTDTSSTDPFYLRGKAEARHHIDAAIADLSEAIKRDPKNADAFLQRAECYFRKNRNLFAEADAKVSLRLDPNVPYVSWLLARIHERLNDYDAALKDVDFRILRKEALDDWYRHRAEVELHMGQTNKAFADYGRALRVNPKNPDTYDIRGKAYVACEKFKLAADDFKKAAELQPNRIGMHYCNLGAMEILLGNYDQALNHLTQAIYADPRSGATRNDRGVCYEKMGDFSKAKIEFEAAIKRNPNSDSYFKNSSRAALESGDVTDAMDGLMGEHDESEAAPAYSKAASQENFHIVINQLNGVIKADPQNGSSYYNRGLTYFCLGSFKLAADDFGKFQQLCDWTGETPVMAGILEAIALRRCGKTTEALNVLHDTMRKSNKSDWTRTLLDDVAENHTDSKVYRSPNGRQRLSTHLMIGLNMIALKNTEVATPNLLRVVRFATPHSDEYSLANAELMRMGVAIPKRIAPLTAARTIHKYNLILHY